jgi:regulator of sirC expression with transglutaminase-like and TPR domain
VEVKDDPTLVYHQLEAMRDVISGDLGFSGDAEDYYNPKNSYLHKVLETKKGLPICLSAIYVSIAARLGIEVHGINIPRHFLLRCKWRGSLLFIDPFNDGKVMRLDELIEFLLTEIRLVASVETLQTVPPVTQLDWIRRMFGNLVGLAQMGRFSSEPADFQATAFKTLAWINDQLN